MALTPNQKAQKEGLFVKQGQALHNWSLVEAYMSILFVKLLRIDNDTAGHAVLNSAINFQTKVDMVEAAAIHSSKSPSLRYIALKLLSKCSKLARRRNKLAHACVDIADGTFKLYPYFSMHVEVGDREYMADSEIVSCQADFLEMRDALKWLIIAVHAASQPEAPLPQFPPLILAILPHTG